MSKWYVVLARDGIGYSIIAHKDNREVLYTGTYDACEKWVKQKLNIKG